MLLNNLWAATKAALADKEHLQQTEYEAKLAQQESSAASSSSLSVTVDRHQHYALGQVIHSQSESSTQSAITSLLYHPGHVVLTSAQGSISILDPVTFALEASATTTHPTSSSPLPITCACLTDALLITGHATGELFSTALTDLPSMTPALLTSFPRSSITALAAHGPLVHIATSTGQFHSFHVGSRHVVHSLTLSSFALTAVVTESADVVWVGDSRGNVRRLSLADRSISTLRVTDGGEEGGLAVRRLRCSPSLLPKKVKKAPAGKKKGNHSEDDGLVEDEPAEVNGPVLLWCAYGPARIRVWDTRDGRNSVVMDYHHVPSDALNALTSSLALAIAPSPVSPTSPTVPLISMGFLSSLPNRPVAQTTALPTAVTAPTLIHDLVVHAGALYTAHEERALGVLPVNIQASAAGATRVLPPSSNGLDMITLQNTFREAVTHLLLVPANPSQPTLPLAQSPAPSGAIPEPILSPSSSSVDADAGEERATPSKPQSAASTAKAEPVAAQGGSSFQSSPYVLAGTASGEVHVFSLGLLERDLNERRAAETRRLDAIVETWADNRTRAGRAKPSGGTVGEGKSKGKGKKDRGGDMAMLSVRDEHKETDSAMTTARD